MEGIALASNMIKMDDLMLYLKKIFIESNLSADTVEVLTKQIKQLEGIYGKVIDRETAYRIIDMQIKVTHTGYFRDPVGIEEFLESVKYMNQKRYLRPKIREHLFRLWNDPMKYDHVILGGAIGTGKNYFLDMSFSYLLYRLSCMYSPQAHFGLAPGSDIVILFQSRNYEAAQKIVFNQFKQRIEASEYFSQNFMYDKRSKNELRFPNNIIIKPISSADTAALSMNVLFAAIDEANFLSIVKRKKGGVKGPNQETYDQAQKLYETVRGRIESRYKTSTGTMGKIFLLSSANYKGDFIDRLEEEAKTNEKIFVMHMSQWESNPTKYSKEVFYVKLPTETASTVIQSEEPLDMKGWITVPIDLRDDFEKTPEECLRSRAGIAIESQHRFMNMADVNEAYENYAKVYGSKTANIFVKDSVVINYVDDLKELIDWNVIKYLKGDFACHIDLGLNTDSGGIAICHVIGGKETTNISEGKYLPIYGVCGVIAIEPPVNEMEDIDLIKIQDLILMLGKHITFKSITLDQFQSASTVQLFKKHGYRSELLSMDRTLEPYVALKTAFRNGRLYLPYHSVLDKEFKFLHQDLVSGKVDHAQGDVSSKDVADAVAGAVYSLSLMKSSYRINTSEIKKIIPIRGEDYIQPELTVGKSRTSTGRVSFYRRKIREF